MRILYFTRSNSVHDRRFLQALADSGHEGYVLRLNPGEYPCPDGVTELSWPGIRGSLRFWQAPALIRRLKAILAELKPDLVHAGPLHDVAWLAAKAGAQTLLAMSWGFDLMHDIHVDSGMYSRTCYSLQHARHLITDAQCSADEAIKLGFDPERISIFPWGVDLEHFSPQASVVAGKRWREKQGWEDKPTLLCLRSWEPNYGVDLLARAFNRARLEAPQLRLILLGDGSQSTLIRGLLAKAEGAGQVFFGGRVPNEELTQFYGAGDVYLSPSHVDGSSVSLMEAMACGLPCLVSNIPANLEWVEDGHQGLVFADNDEEALAEAILAVLFADLRKMRQEARLKAQEKADWTKNREMLYASYQLCFDAKKETK